MANRFNWEPDNNEDDEVDPNEEDWELDEKLDQSLKNDLVNVQLDQIDILQQDVDEKIMQDAITVASKDWFWSFRSSSTKMKTIKRIYVQMKKILDS